MTLKELKRFMQLCRQQGVQSIKYQDTEIHFTDLPQYNQVDRQAFPESIISSTYNPGDVTEETKIVVDKVLTDELTDEQKLFWSATGEVEQQQ